MASVAATLSHMPNPEPLLRSAYRAFNARDIDAALELMHPEVDWPNASLKSQMAASPWTSIRSFTTQIPVGSSQSPPSVIPTNSGTE
jgi:uncharacterized protein YchJ